MPGPPPIPPVPASPPPVPPLLVMCPKCKNFSSGNYCYHCGAPLHEEDSGHDPFVSFATSFLNIGNIRNWLTMFFTILPKPAANTIRLYKEVRFESALKFMEFSFGFYTLLTAGKITFIALGERISKQPMWKDIFSEIIFLLFAIAGYMITLKLFYWFASKRYGHKNKRDYIKMYCLSAGFLLPAMAIAYYITGGLILNSIDFELPIMLLVFKAIILMALGISSLIYGTICWKYFWNAPNQKVFALLLWGGLLSFIICFIVLVAIFWSLDIDLVPTQR